MSIRTYVVSLLALAAIVVANNIIVAYTDLFESEDIAQHQLFLTLSPYDAAATKLHHGRKSPRYDVGLFGNSRVIMVGKDDLFLPEAKVFNFAIGGQSFRNSVEMLNELDKAGKAPKVAVLSFDYVELGLPGGAPITPGVFGRTLDRVDDMKWLVMHEHLPKTVAVAAWNYTVQEVGAFKSFVSLEAFINRLKVSTGWVNKTENGTLPSFDVKADGSIKPLNQKAQNIGKWHPSPRAENYPMLEYDFEKLAHISDRGTKILIYESPLEPTAMLRAEENLSQNAINVRKRLFQSCERAGITCFGAPKLHGTATSQWKDATHAPSDTLGKWIGDTISAMDILK